MSKNWKNCKRFLFIGNQQVFINEVYMITAVDWIHARRILAKERNETESDIANKFRWIEAKDIKQLNVGLTDVAEWNKKQQEKNI